MDRHVVASLVAPKRLAHLLTFASQSFMALHRIIIDIGENMSRGGTLSVPPPWKSYVSHFTEKNRREGNVFYEV